MADSDSSLSSPPSTDDEMPVDTTPVPGPKSGPAKKKQGNILTFFKQKERSPTPPRKKRDPSPEHIYVPEDNPDIAVRTGRVNRVVSRRDASPYAVSHYVSVMLTFLVAKFIVMFRSRFNEAFPRGAPTVGPQDIEQGVAEGTPSTDVEGLLCALLGLVLNRKKPVESVSPIFCLNTLKCWSHRVSEY